jgi:hypothetical protein
MPQESLHRDYGRLAGFLRKISLRLRLLSTLQYLLLLSAGFIIVLLGSLFVQELKEIFSYLPFVYSVVAILFLSALLFLGLWRVLFRPPIARVVARDLEEKFPQLRDDVTNSLLLYHQINGRADSSQISEGLVKAQLKKTADEVCAIQPRQVVSFKRALSHLRLLLPLVLAFSAVLALDPHFLTRSLALIIHPFSALPMKETFISVEPGRSIVLRGTLLVIKAKATGKKPDKLTLIVWPEGREAMHLGMESMGDGNFIHQMASAQFSFSYQASSGNAASPVYSIRVVDPPEVGKLKLTLLPPGYTGLPKEVREEGHIEALKGTVVNLEIQTTKRVSEGKIILNPGNELLLRVDGDRLSGSILVFYPGTYSIKLKDELGFENPNPVAYQIHLLPDQYPEGEILSPAKDLEISGSEVIPVVYTAKDDFGLTAVRLSYQIRGREDYINLKNTVGGRSLGPDTLNWDLGSLALMAGESMMYRLEVWDNDSISGPKKGYSQAYTLSVRDERARAATESEEAQQISDALLDMLADHLDATKDTQTLSKGMEELLKRLDKNLDRMRERPERFDFEALKRNLASLRERMLEESKETVTQEMERLALLAEDIAKRARMNEVEALAREMRNRQRRLIDSLNEFKGPLGGKDLESLMKELKSLRDLLHTVMEALSKLATRLPDEFINSQELSGLDFQDLFKDLEEIEKKLMAGDISGALEAAQRLMQALSEMMASLGRAGAQAGMAPFDRLQAEMSRQTGELGRIMAEQNEILTETERIDKELKRLTEEEIENRLKHSLSEFKRTLEEINGSLPSEQRESTEELDKLLKDGKLEKFSEVAKELEKELSGRPDIQKLVRELRESIEGLSPHSEEVMTPENKEKFPGLSSRQDSLRERTKDLKEKLEMIAQLFPGMDTEILNDFREATSSMGGAAGKLKGEDAPGAIPPEQEAIRRLTRSQQAMQEMAQQMAMRMQGARWGYQWGYDPRAGWYYGPWAPMPTLPQPELNRPRERGYTGFEKEEFELPSKDAYKVPKIYREKILESLKEGVPPEYKREVERYFRGLTE